MLYILNSVLEQDVFGGYSQFLFCWCQVKLAHLCPHSIVVLSDAIFKRDWLTGSSSDLCISNCLTVVISLFVVSHAAFVFAAEAVGWRW